MNVSRLYKWEVARLILNVLDSKLDENSNLADKNLPKVAESSALFFKTTSHIGNLSRK